jgi:hypothetical protein
MFKFTVLTAEALLYASTFEIHTKTNTKMDVGVNGEETAELYHFGLIFKDIM